MLLAPSNIHFRNNLILGKSETLETFAIETNTNYSSSDYNGFRPNEGAEFSFEWSTPPMTMHANFLGEPGIRSTQEQTIPALPDPWSMMPPSLTGLLEGSGLATCRCERLLLPPSSPALQACERF